MTRVLAILVAFNEADVLDATLRALAEQGCDAYVVDHGSTDGTGDIARARLGRGVVGVERFPEDSGFPARNERTMVWADLLRRREQIVRERDYDWYVLNDADEFREAPWPGLTLAEGLARAERLGYNAVNFRCLNFRPTGPGFEPGDDPREILTGYEPADPCDSAQVKAFKRPEGALDVLGAGGHDVRFDGRRVCPVPFVLRHYPIRSPEHGRRKVYGERLPRFAAEERANGWHVQYDELVEQRSAFAWDPAALRTWDPALVRAELLADAADAILVSAHSRGADLTEVDLQRAPLRPWVDRRLGFAADEDAHRRARAAFDRLLRSEAPAAVAADDPDVAPLVIALLDALVAQMQVAGRVLDAPVAQRMRRDYAGALGFPGARRFVALVDAGEALDAPGLVAAFASAFDSASDATLVLSGDGWSDERLAAELGPLADGLGADAPDLLAVGTVPADLADRIHVVLSERAPRPALAAIPHLGADVPRLRELAAEVAA